MGRRGLAAGVLAVPLLLAGCDCGGGAADDAGADLRDGGVHADAGNSDATIGDALGADAALPDLFLDPGGGDDGNPCSQAQPCKTIAHALGIVATGQTILLGDGEYSAASGETWDVPVPDGVTIEAVNPGQAVLIGPGVYEAGQAFSFAGSGALGFMQIKQFAQAIDVSAGTVHVEQVELVENYFAVVARRVAAVTLEDCIIRDGNTGFYVQGIAKLSVNGGRLSGLGASCNGGVGEVGEAAQLVADSVEVSGNAGSLEVRGAASAAIINSVFDGSNPPVCSSRSAIDGRGAPSVRLDNTIIRNIGDRGIAMLGGSLTIVGGTVDDCSDTAIHFEGETLDVSGTHFSRPDREKYAIYVTDAHSARINDVDISGFYYGIFVGRYLSVTVRGATLTGNRTGVATWSGVDLGTAASPGRNIIQQNTSANLSVSGDEVFTVRASGNTWDPGIQGADAQGHMNAGATLTGATNGANFQLSSDGPTIQF